SPVMMRRVVRQDVVSRALAALTPSVRELAREVHVTYASLYAWAAGRRTPTAANLKRLAEAAERRARMLTSLAAELRRVAESDP
ncbi:MAG TPA: helix-turn-helix transcriptional regulator, partial [Longimicrobiales bacterium]